MSQNTEQNDYQPRKKQGSVELGRGVSLTYLLSQVDNIKTQYPEATDFEIEADDYYDSVTLYINYYRNETDQEKKEREEREALIAKRQVDYERQQYETLKKKFEND